MSALLDAPRAPQRPPRPRRPDAAASGLEARIAALAPISLSELESVAALMTRVDRKYVLPPAAVAGLVASLRARAAVLEIDAKRRFHYRSLYFDTGDRASYLGAATGRRQRFKVRTRLYDDQVTCVLEVKVPGSRGETVKDRIPYDAADRNRLTAEARAFIDAQTRRRGLGVSLGPVLVTSYLRSTLVDQTDGARITIDRALRCADVRGAARDLVGPVILETKSGGSATAADRWLWHHGCRPVKISKFCVGMALFDPRLPANKWNRVLRRHFAWAPSERPLPISI
jgi:hypothetical protein